MTLQALSPVSNAHIAQRIGANLVVTALLCLLSFASLAQTSAGTVMVVTGRVVAIDLQGRERELQKGGDVFPGDRVVTADAALAQIRMLDGGYLSILSSTEMAIEKFVHDEKNQSNSSIVLGLIKGGLRSITGLVGRNNPAAYQVRTSTATIGIRGTDHEPMFIPANLPGVAAGDPSVVPGLYDKVNSGETFIRNDLGTISLKPGQVGFSPIKPEVPPQMLLKVPEFYKAKLAVDRPEGKDVDEGERKPAPTSKGLRPTTASRLATQKTLDGAAISDKVGTSTLLGTKTLASEPVPMSATTSTQLEPVKSTSTLMAPTTLQTTSTTTLQPATTTLTAPTTTLIAPTTLTAPTTTLIAPTATTSPATSTYIAPKTTTYIAPTTTIQPTTTTISPLLTSPTLIAPLPK